jgi:uncharacterized membrane protein
MSEQLTAFEPDTPTSHPIHLVVTDDLERSRLTVFFRLLLALPHLVWVAIWGIAVFFAVIAAWFVGIFTGRVPEGIHDFIATWVRYATHVNAYFSLAADPFPDFGGAPGYPVDVDIAPPHKQSRLTIFFRGLLAIPAFIVLYLLGYVAQIVMFFAWFIALFTGRLPNGLRDVLAYWLRYGAQTYGYQLLLTQKYPSFSDD